MQHLMDSKNKLWHQYMFFTIAAISLYQTAMICLLWKSIQDVVSIQGLKLAALIFCLALFVFAIAYFCKNRVWISRWAIIFLIIISASLSVYRIADWYLSITVNSTYLYVFEWQQVLVFAGLYFIGMLFIWCVCEKISALKLCLYGFVTGCCLWVILSSILVYTGLLLSWWTMTILLVGVLSFVYLWRRPKLPNKSMFKLLGIYSLVFVNICILLPHVIGAEFSYDSFKYLKYGLMLGEHGGLAAAGITGEMVSSYALFVPSMNAMSVIFNFSESNTFITIMYACFFGIFAYELTAVMKENGLHKRLWLPVALAVIMMVSTCTFMTLGTWHLNNGPAAVILFLLAITLHHCIKTKDLGYAVISAVLISALILSRVEMPLYCALLLIIISTLSVTKKQMLIMFVIPVSVLAVYYVGFFAQYGFSIDTAFLSVGRALPIIMIYIAVGIYLLLIWRRYLLKIQKYIFSIICVAMIIVFIGLSLLQPSKSAHNLYIIVWHTLYANYWGYAWHVMLGLMPVVCLTIRRKQLVNIAPVIKRIAITYALFIIIIFLFRQVPLRYGDGDSGNRLIAQFFPFIVFWFFALLSPLLTRTKEDDNNVSKVDQSKPQQLN